MPCFRMTFLARVVGTASVTLLAGMAQATTTEMQLRFLGFDTVSVYQGTSTVGATGADRFNNGVPLNGITYQPLYNGSPNPNSLAQTGGYGNSTFGPATELNGASGDFLGSQYGAGALTFRRSDATLGTTNLTPAGYANYNLSLSPSVVSGTSLGLIGNDSGFDLQTVWDYPTLRPGEAIVMGLSGTPSGTSYTDRLQLRYGVNVTTGLAFLNFEQQTRSGSVFSRITLGSTTPSALVSDLSAVDYIGLSLHRDMPTSANPNPTVSATVKLFDAAVDGSGNLLSLGNISFSMEGNTFQNAGSQFQGVFTSASWTELAAVPEPGTWALLLAGSAIVGGVARRGRSGS